MPKRLKTILIVGGAALVLALFVPESAKQDGFALHLVAPILTGAIIIAFGVYIVSAGVRSGTEKPQVPAPPQAVGAKPSRHAGVQLLTMPDDFGLAPPALPSAAGRFRVSGVDRETRMDTVWHCSAENEANARAKGDLEGIVVTAVEREG